MNHAVGRFGLALESGIANWYPPTGQGAQGAFKLSGYWTEGRQGFHASDGPAAPLLLGQ